MYGYIYLIVNKLDGRTYVGKRKFRNKNQKWDTDGYMGSGCHLKNSQAKYGIENFEKFLITWTYSEEDACEKEKFWIAEYRRRGKAEYNYDDGGKPTAHNKGKHFSEYVRKRISEAHKGIPHPWITSEVGKKVAETKKRRKAEGKVYKRTGWEKGHVPWNKGKERDWPVSEQEHINRSLAHKGKHLSDGVKKEMIAKRNETLKAIDFHSNKGMHWKLVDGKRIYYKQEE